MSDLTVVRGSKKGVDDWAWALAERRGGGRASVEDMEMAAAVHRTAPAHIVADLCRSSSDPYADSAERRLSQPPLLAPLTARGPRT
jgi:hypothetical protein